MPAKTSKQPRNPPPRSRDKGKAKLVDQEGQRREEEDEEEEVAWKATDLLLNRTLHLQTLSPIHLHIPPAAAAAASSSSSSKAPAVTNVTTSLLRSLAPELHSFVNLRLSDGLSYAGPEDNAHANGNGVEAESGSGRSRKRRRVAMDRVGRVEMRMLDLQLDGNDDDASVSPGRSPQGGASSTRRGQTPSPRRPPPWAIELEMGSPAEPTSASSPPPRSQDDMCHLIFLPSLDRSDEAPFDSRHTRSNNSSLSYPLLITKAASSSPMGPSALAHALDWVQSRFDCRVGSAAALGTRISGRFLEGLLERTVDGMRGPDGSLRPEETGAASTSANVRPPVELAYAFPGKRGGTDDPEEPERTVAPDLQALTFSVPWEMVAKLLEPRGVTQDMPLLPALTFYLSQHASLPLSRLTLVRLGVAGVYLGSSSATSTAGGARLKFIGPKRRGSANKDGQQDETWEARLGSVLSYLVEGLGRRGLG